MELATSIGEGTSQVGVVIGEKIVPVPGVTDLITRWDAAKPKANPAGGAALSSIRLTAPVPHSGKTLAIRMNYADHIADVGRGTPEH